MLFLSLLQAKGIQTFSPRFKIRNAEVSAQFYDDHNFRCDKTHMTHCFPLLSPATNSQFHYIFPSQMGMSVWAEVREGQRVS